MLSAENVSTLKCIYVKNAAVLCQPKHNLDQSVAPLVSGDLSREPNYHTNIRATMSTTISQNTGQFCVFTNASREFKGQPIAIRRDLVVTIYPNLITGDAESAGSTLVFVPPHGTWEIEETFQQAMAIVNENHS